MGHNNRLSFQVGQVPVSYQPWWRKRCPQTRPASLRAAQLDGLHRVTAFGISREIHPSQSSASEMTLRPVHEVIVPPEACGSRTTTHTLSPTVSRRYVSYFFSIGVNGVQFLSRRSPRGYPHPAGFCAERRFGRGGGVYAVCGTKRQLGIVDHGSGSCVVLTRVGDLACYSSSF